MNPRRKALARVERLTPGTQKRTVAYAVGSAVLVLVLFTGLAFANSISVTRVAKNARSLHWTNATKATTTSSNATTTTTKPDTTTTSTTSDGATSTEAAIASNPTISDARPTTTTSQTTTTSEVSPSTTIVAVPPRSPLHRRAGFV